MNMIGRPWRLLCVSGNELDITERDGTNSGAMNPCGASRGDVDTTSQDQTTASDSPQSVPDGVQRRPYLCPVTRSRIEGFRGIEINGNEHRSIPRSCTATSRRSAG